MTLRSALETAREVVSIGLVSVSLGIFIVACLLLSGNLP